MKRLLTLFLMFACLYVQAQDQPKLVVGIVVDQMRMDYLYRYWDKYSDEGFKKLMTEGYVSKNMHYNYIPTYTGPGHASIYTGTTPMDHGIIANDWFDKRTGQQIYCVQDESVDPLGTTTDAGKMSPTNLLAPTLGDAVRLASHFNGKSFGVSIKDRGAILPAGHSANGAFWFDYKTGNMISSNHYFDALPAWVNAFNAEKNPDKLSAKGWNTLLAIEKYDESTKDATAYEKVIGDKKEPVFPYDLPTLIKEENYAVFAMSPFSNTFLRQFSERLITQEDLGEDDNMDFLSISFSGPDIAGHAFGPQSIEVEDTYLRLDLEIAALISMLDERVGASEYVLFLTADHGAAHNPLFQQDHHLPVAQFDSKGFKTAVNDATMEAFGSDQLTLNFSNQQIFLSHTKIKELGLDLDEVVDVIKETALTFEGVAAIYSTEDLSHPLPDNSFAQRAHKGWNMKRSCDLFVQYDPGWLSYSMQGTSHGTSYNYDTHVPFLLYGKGVKKGVGVDPVDITQIAPTICLITSIAFPDLSDTRVISEAVKE